jgi:hypothetical protein
MLLSESILTVIVTPEIFENGTVLLDEAFYKLVSSLPQNCQTTSPYRSTSTPNLCKLYLKGQRTVCVRI